MASFPSQVDPTFPPDNVAVSKATMRTQFTTIRDELDHLLRKDTLAYKVAFGELKMLDTEL